MHLFSIATRRKKYQVLDACFKKRRKRYCRRLAGCGAVYCAFLSSKINGHYLKSS